MECPSLVIPVTTAMFTPQESWASDVGMVRDYMCTYLKEGSSEAVDPSFQLDEVGGPTQHPSRGVSPAPSGSDLSAFLPVPHVPLLQGEYGDGCQV